jgi:hypothetical protein
MNNHNQEAAKLITDGLSVVTVVGTLAGLLPAVAALFTIIWTAIRIYETATVQRWLRK